MSCNADKAVQTLVARELQRRINGLNGIIDRHMGAWANQHRQQGAGYVRQVPRVAVSAGMEFALREGLRTVLSAVIPPPSPAVRAAAQQKYLGQLYNSLILRGVDPVAADKLVQGEACLLHVADALASGELVAGAVKDLE